jgi:hypothetical protein
MNNQLWCVTDATLAQSFYENAKETFQISSNSTLW